MARSRSASGKTIAGDLPPSSSETRFRLPAAALTISLPTSVEPVKATLSTSGCSASAAPAVSPKPVTMLTTPSGKPGFLDQFAEAQRRERRLLGRLQHDGAAGRQRRRQLPGRHHQREVPGDDLADDADRLAQRVGVPVAGARDRDGLAVQARRPARHVAEHVDRALHVAVAGIGDRLAVVERLEFGELVGMLLEEIAEAPDEPRRARPARCVDQGPVSKARRAAATARSMSALSPAGTCAMISSVAGSSTGKVLPLRAATHLPSISIFDLWPETRGGRAQRGPADRNRHVVLRKVNLPAEALYPVEYNDRPDTRPGGQSWASR